MRDDQKFNIEFVGIVEKYPVIYDYTMTGYSKKNIIDKVWKDVATKINHQLKENCSGDDCKNRWRVLRSSYVRSKNKKAKSGDGLTGQRQYYLSECMHFLQPFTKSRTQSGNIPSVIEPEPSDGDEIMQDGLEDDDDDDSGSVASDLSDISPPGRKKVVLRRGNQGRQLDRFERRTLEYYEAKRKTSTESPDLHFFRGLLPYVEGFTPLEKLKFQKSVLDVISSIYDERSLESQGSSAMPHESQSGSRLGT